MKHKGICRMHGDEQQAGEVGGGEAMAGDADKGLCKVWEEAPVHIVDEES